MALLAAVPAIAGTAAAGAAAAGAAGIGITTAIAGTGIAGGFLASTALGSVLLRTGFSLGMSLLQKALGGDQGAGPVFAVQGTLRSGGEVPRTVPFGRFVTGGSFVWGTEWGQAGKTPNAWFTQVIQVADLPIKGLLAVWVNGVRCTLLTAEAHPDYGVPVQEFRVGIKDHLWVRLFDGTQTAAPAFLTGLGRTGRPYEATRVGVGCAYAVCTGLLNRDLFTGFPEYRFEVDGARLYDPSRDSSVGGDGAQRWDTPSTWGGDGDDLVAVQLYNVLRGIAWNGAWLYGWQGVEGWQLPAAGWIAAIAACRATGVIGTVEDPLPTYRSGGELVVSEESGPVIDALLAACGGRLVEVASTYTLHIGENPGAADHVITDGDIIITQPQSYSPFPGLSDTINGIEARYPEPDQAWAMVPAPPLFDAALEAQDGNRRLVARVDMPMVSTLEQVEYLMQATLREARRARFHTMVMPPKFWRARPWQTVDWTSPANGYEAKRFRIESVTDLPNGLISWDLRETDPAAYSWDRTADFRPAAYPPVALARPAPRTVLVDAGNLVPDAGVQDGDLWTVPAPFDWRVQATVGFRSRGAFLYDHAGGTGISASVIGPVFPVEPGSSYHARFQTVTAGATAYRVRGWVRWLDEAGVHFASTDIAYTTTSATTVQTWSAVLTAPATARQARVLFAVDRSATDGDVWIGGPVMRERARGDDLRDGVITRPKLVVGAVADRGLETDAAVYSTTSASFAAAGLFRLTVLDLADLDTLIVNWGAEIRSTAAGTTARAALYMRSRPSGGVYSAWAEVNPNAPTRFGNGLTTFVGEEASALLPAPDEQVQFAIWLRSDGGASVEIQEQRLRPLVVRV